MTPHEKHRKRELASATSACLADPPAESIAEGWGIRLIKNDKSKQLPVVANALIARVRDIEVEVKPLGVPPSSSQSGH